jgi:hypothetical protein
MTIYKIQADPNCKSCHGSGTVVEYHPYGSTVAGESLTCDCVMEQLPEEYDSLRDTVDVEETGWTGGDGPEFEYDNFLDEMEY